MGDRGHDQYGNQVHDGYYQAHANNKANFGIDKSLALPAINDILPVRFKINLINKQSNNDHAGQVKQQARPETNGTENILRCKQVQRIPFTAGKGANRGKIDFIKYINDQQDAEHIQDGEHLEYPVVLDFHPFYLKIL